MQGYFTLREGLAFMEITAETAEALTRLESLEASLRAFLTEAGVGIGSLAFTLTEQASPENQSVSGSEAPDAARRITMSEYEFVV